MGLQVSENIWAKDVFLGLKNTYSIFFLRFIYLLFIYLIYFWLHQVFVVACGILRCGTLVLRCGTRPSLQLQAPGHVGSVVVVRGLQLRRTSQQLWHVGLVAPQHVGSQFPDQGSNPCPLHCKEDSLPLDHQGSLHIQYLKT